MNFASNAALQSHFPERVVVFMDYKKKKILHTLYKLLASYSIYFLQKIQIFVCIYFLTFVIIWIYFKGLSYSSLLLLI